MELCPCKLDLFRIAYLPKNEPIGNVQGDKTHSKKHLKGVWMDLLFVPFRTGQ